MELRQYAAQDAFGLAALVRNGDVSAAEVETAARHAIDAVGPQLHATVGELIEPAFSATEEGPFAGVPFALKEVAPHAEGQRTQLGSRLTGEGVVGAADTHLMQRFRAAGFRVLARTRSPEFAFNATTEPLVHGPTRSPWDLERSVGGSSGGAAALVAARALPVAHATDGGGSIRIPASLCGLVGLKPTRSRTPVGPGQWEALHGMGHDFLLARTLRDVAAALDAIHGPGVGDKYEIGVPARPYVDELDADPRRLRAAWTTDAWSGEPVDAECCRAVEAAASALDEQGHEVVGGAPVIDHEVMHRALVTAWAAGMAQRTAIAERALGVEAGPETVEACSLAMLRHGVTLSATDLLNGYADCDLVGRGIGAFFQDVDVLVLPSVARIPWRLGELDQNDPSLDHDGWVRKLFDRYCPFTAMFNITGQPAMSLPLAWTDSGLPVGVQLVGRYGDEATLFRVAEQLEQAFPWADRVPPVAVGA
ncbi:MAG: amidase [Actinomycetia bacterium]|nr:amidase [Actinomycetes bacterium]